MPVRIFPISTIDLYISVRLQSVKLLTLIFCHFNKFLCVFYYERFSNVDIYFCLCMSGIIKRVATYIYIYILCYSNINWYQVEINIVLPLWTIYIDKSHNDETTVERNIHHCPCLRSLWWSYFLWVFWIYYGQDIFYTPLRQILYKNIRRKISCSGFQLNIEIYRQRFIYQQ